MDNGIHQATRLDAIEGRYDPLLVGLFTALAAFGVAMVGSSSMAIGEDLGRGPFHFLVRHVVSLAIGIVLCVVAARTPLKTLERYPQGLLLACVILLALVFVPGLGRTVNGARRWITLVITNFQVVEAVKVIYIVWLAS